MIIIGRKISRNNVYRVTVYVKTGGLLGPSASAIDPLPVCRELTLWTEGLSRDRGQDDVNGV